LSAHSNATSENVSWPHFSWHTLYMYAMLSRVKRSRKVTPFNKGVRSLQTDRQYVVVLVYSFRRYVSATTGLQPEPAGFWTRSRLIFRRRENAIRSPVIVGSKGTKMTDGIRSRLHRLPFVSVGPH